MPWSLSRSNGLGPLTGMEIHFPPSSEDVGGVVPIVEVEVVAVEVELVVVVVVAPIGTVVVSVPAICTLILETVTMMLVTSFSGGASVTSILTYPLPAAELPDSVLVFVVPNVTPQLVNNRASMSMTVNITELFMTYSSYLENLDSDNEKGPSNVRCRFNVCGKSTVHDDLTPQL